MNIKPTIAKNKSGKEINLFQKYEIISVTDKKIEIQGPKVKFTLVKMGKNFYYVDETQNGSPRKIQGFQQFRLVEETLEPVS